MAFLVKMVSKWLQRELTRSYSHGPKSLSLLTRMLFLPWTMSSLLCWYSLLLVG